MLLNETVNYVFNSNALHTEYTSMLSFHQCSGQEKNFKEKIRTLRANQK